MPASVWQCERNASPFPQEGPLVSLRRRTCPRAADVMGGGVFRQSASAGKRRVFCHCRVMRQSCFVILFSSPPSRPPAFRPSPLVQCFPCACTVLAAPGGVSGFEDNCLGLQPALRTFRSGCLQPCQSPAPPISEGSMQVGQRCISQVRSGQGRTGQGRSSQVKSGQVIVLFHTFKGNFPLGECCSQFRSFSSLLFFLFFFLKIEIHH